MLGGTGIWSRAQALVVIAVAAYLIPETDDARAAIPARHVEAGLFLHGGSPVTAPCDDVVRTAPGTAAAVDPGGLHAVLLLDGPDAATADTSLAFFEVRSASSGGTIHVYNFTHQGGEYRLHVPPDALAGISDMADPAADEYGVRAVSWPVTIYDGGIYQAKYIGNENVGMDDYATFGSNTGWAVLGQAVVRGGGGSAEARPSATAGEPGAACVVFGTATINDDVDPVAIPNSPYNIYRVERGETFEDPGATCYDDTSGPYQVSGEPYAHVSTSDIVDARGVQGIDYACVDLAGNPSRTVRTDVLVDDLGEDGTEPVVTVVGDAAADVPNGEGYYEEGAVCRDGIEGYLPISRTIYALRMHPFEEGRPNAIDAGLAATWKATYECSDSSGNVGVNTLPVPSDNSRIVRTNGDVGDFLTGPDPVRIRSGGELPRPLSIQCSHSNEVDPDPWTMDLETPGTRTYDYECIISKVVIPRTFIITEEEPDISDGHPVVRLLGDVRISHGDGIPYVERGAVCGDPEDGALPVTIIYPAGVADGSTLPGTASEFHVGYVCEDAAGNQAFTSRTAVLDDRRGPEIIPNLANNTVHQWAAQLDPAPDAECVDPSGIKSKRVVHSIDVDAVGGYEIRFECTDSFDNTSELEYRFLVADMVPPTARFSSPHPHPHNSAYVPPEAICDDNYDGEGYARAAAEGPVDHRVPGDYNVTYTCTDSHGNRLVANGTVSVVPDDGPPVITIHGEPEMGPDRAVVPGPWATCTDYPPGGPPEGIAIPMHDPPLKALPARSFVVEMSYGIPDGGMVAVNATLTCRDDSGNVATRVASGTIPPDVTTQDPATPTESGPDPPAVPGPSNPTNKTDPDPVTTPKIPTNKTGPDPTTAPKTPTNKTNPDPTTAPKTPTNKTNPDPTTTPKTPTNKTGPDPVTTPKTPTSKPDPTPVPGPSTPTNKTNPDPTTTPKTPTNKTSPDPTTTPKTPTNKPDPPAVPGPSTPTNKTNPDPVTTPKTPTNKTSPDPTTTPKIPTNKTNPDPVTTPKTPTNK
ncbi:MAG: hypothetical protein MPJ05_07655, partial [Nitrosopumilus sp.]|nr:hypothetical protein [Nitrosopumilus sp.]